MLKPILLKIRSLFLLIKNFGFYRGIAKYLMESNKPIPVFLLKKLILKSKLFRFLICKIAEKSSARTMLEKVYAESTNDWTTSRLAIVAAREFE